MKAVASWIRHFRLIVIGVLFGALAACTPVSFFFSESTSDRFGNIWMTVKSIALINSDEQKIFIYGDPEGTVININGSDDVAELFNLRSIPEGTYSSLEVTFDPSVIVTAEDGEQTEHQLDGQDKPGHFVIPCLHVLEEDVPGAVVIAFDLEELVLSGEQLSIEPAMGCQNSGAIKNLARQTARWHGDVLEVLGENSFVLGAQFWHRDVEITVVLNDAGAVFDEESGEAESTVAKLDVGDRVRVAGGFDFTTFTLDAESVSVKGRDESDEPDDDRDDSDDPDGDDGQGNENGQGNGQGNDNNNGNGQGNGNGGGQGDGDGSDDSDADADVTEDEDIDKEEGKGASREVVGSVLDFDGGSTLTISVIDANFSAPTELVIAGISDARFQRGSLEILNDGQEVELRGSWDGLVYTAKFVNIVGAKPGQSMADAPLTKVSGTVTAVDGTQVTLAVEADGEETPEPADSSQDDPPLTDITFDISEAFLARGRESCIQVGTRLQAWGSTDDDGFYPVRLSVKGKCSGDDTPPSDDDQASE